MKFADVLGFVTTIALVLGITTAQAEQLKLISTDNTEITVEYSTSKEVTSSNKPATLMYANINGIWVQDTSDRQSQVNVVLVQREYTDNQCGGPGSYRERAYRIALDKYSGYFYSPGILFQGTTQETPAKVLISAEGYCYSTKVVNEVAIETIDSNGNATWLVDPVSGVHNFKLML